MLQPSGHTEEFPTRDQQAVEENRRLYLWRTLGASYLIEQQHALRSLGQVVGCGAPHHSGSHHDAVVHTPTPVSWTTFLRKMMPTKEAVILLLVKPVVLSSSLHSSLQVNVVDD